MKLRMVFLGALLMVMYFQSTARSWMYEVSQITTGSTDHKWPSVNNIGDIIWCQQVGSYWHVFKNGGQITSGDHHHRYPAISDDGNIVYVKYGVGQGVQRQVIRHPSDVIEFSTVNIYNPSQHRDAGEHPDISRDAEIIWYYDWYDGSGNFYRRLKTSERGQIYDNLLGDYPSIAPSTQYVYEYVYEASGQVFSNRRGRIDESGSIPRISDAGIVYISAGQIKLFDYEETNFIHDLNCHMIPASYADVNDNGVIVFERDVGGHAQVFKATPLVATKLVFRVTQSPVSDIDDLQPASLTLYDDADNVIPWATYSGNCYSGVSDVKCGEVIRNNPHFRCWKDKGPIPPGIWRVNPAFLRTDLNTGRESWRYSLEPVSVNPSDICGRDAFSFQIHGWGTSTGCIMTEADKWNNFQSDFGCAVNVSQLQAGTFRLEVVYDFPGWQDKCHNTNCDLNGDGWVNQVDVAFFALHWWETGCDLLNNWCEGADVTRDGFVNWKDLRDFATNWLAGVE